MRKKILVGMLTTVLLLLTVGLSYSYFTGKVNGEDKELLVTSKNVKILFTDSREIANDGIKPGWNDSKTFSVKNESNDNFNYNIVFENLVNTFVTSGFLQYKITSSNGYNMEGYLDIPKSSSPKTVVLAYDIDLPVDTTHEYTIEFVYHDSETVDQSDDMGKIFEGNLAIIEGSANPDIKYTVTMTSDKGIINPTSNKAIKYENLEYEVTPNTGYDINTMSVSCTPVANTVIIDNKIRVNDIRQSHDCTVSFDKTKYTVNIVVNNGKSDALNKVVEHGGFGTATITPNYGYTLSGATVEGTGCNIEGDILTISDVTSNGTCEVTLPRDKYTVTLNAEHITSDSPKTVEYEGSTTINITPEEGYTIDSNVVCDNATPSIEGNILTVSNVTANTTCTIGSNINSYRVDIKVTNGTSDYEYKTVNHGSNEEFNITVDTGYTMTGASITGDYCSIEGNKVIVSNVKSNTTCTLSLVKERYSVSLSGSNVTVTGSPSSALYQESTTFTVSAGTGFTLSEASISCDNASGSISGNTVTVSNVVGNTVCTISAKQLKYNVTLNVINGAGSETKEVNHGSSATFEITASTNYTLDNPDISCTGGTYTSGKLEVKNVTSNITCTVTLKLVKYKVSVTVSGGSSNPTYKDVEQGSDGTFEITANTNYNLANASVTSGDCTLGSVSNNKRILTASNVTGTRSCTVTIPLKTYTATVNVSGGTAKYGSNSASSKVTASISHGSSPTFTIVASTGYNLSSATVSGTGCSLSSDKSTLTISNITGARTCNVTIPKKTYTVSVSVNDSTMGSVNPASSTVNYGSNLTITITPNSGYKYSSNDCGLTVTNNKMTFTNITEAKNCQVTFVGLSTLADTIKEAYSPQNGRTDFSVIDDGTPALYTGTDNQGTTYYFSGDGTAMNNWVSFAGKMWRIIRINGNGSVRLLYAGTGGTDGYLQQSDTTNSALTNMDAKGLIKYNDVVTELFPGTGISDPMGVGWKYGTSGSLANNRKNTNTSVIYKVVENWYNNKIKINYENYIDKEAIYCNDRKLASGETYSITENNFFYASYYRLRQFKPTFTCSDNSDKFTGIDSIPVGLMTADEIVYAGGTYNNNLENNSNLKAYYRTNSKKGSSVPDSSWWTMTPSSYSRTGYKASLFIVYDGGLAENSYDDKMNLGLVRPVISLKSSVLVTGGNGSGSSPYTLQMP